ncbi:MAG: thiamine phosphate synthase [Eubacterium sp.]|jgi:thiamine-phosphate diphosphorylase|nr:thiamine phosphate synthase [Eubacterium sp.]
MSDLLCVTNRTLCAEDFLERIEKTAACHPRGILLREKDLSETAYEKLAAEVLAICQRHQVPCILHSFPETALRLHVSAVHLPLPLLRNMTDIQKMTFQAIGSSCHSLQEAKEAKRLGCTYIIAGHIFATACKPRLRARGIPFLKELCANTALPVYAIGGINSENAPFVRRAGAKGLCVMSGIMQCKDPAAYLKNMEESR